MFAVVRIRGTVHAKPQIRDTLHMLNLTAVNNCTLIPGTDSYRGMLQKVKDYVTWGEISASMLEQLLAAKTDLEGDHLQQAVEQLMNDDTKLGDVASPTLRLHPPVKGYEGIKRPYRLGGALGYRGDDINLLLERMI
ncbi:MAG: 50S ribosomal protein L30 [Thermoplasmatota archaeon]